MLAIAAPQSNGHFLEMPQSSEPRPASFSQPSHSGCNPDQGGTAISSPPQHDITNPTVLARDIGMTTKQIAAHRAKHWSRTKVIAVTDAKDSGKVVVYANSRLAAHAHGFPENLPFWLWNRMGREYAGKIWQVVEMPKGKLQTISFSKNVSPPEYITVDSPATAAKVRAALKNNRCSLCKARLLTQQRSHYGNWLTLCRQCQKQCLQHRHCGKCKVGTNGRSASPAPVYVMTVSGSP